MVYLVCMDAKRKVLGVHKLGEGSVNAADITSRKVVETALAQNATTAILAHNHISGLALPSQADLTTTRRLGGGALRPPHLRRRRHGLPPGQRPV